MCSLSFFSYTDKTFYTELLKKKKKKAYFEPRRTDILQASIKLETVFTHKHKVIITKTLTAAPQLH